MGSSFHEIVARVSLAEPVVRVPPHAQGMIWVQADRLDQFSSSNWRADYCYGFSEVHRWFPVREPCGDATSVGGYSASAVPTGLDGHFPG
jgi:hypothetical protein